MGKAILLSDSDFSGYGLGVVTLKTGGITPSPSVLTESTTFKMILQGIERPDAIWAISDPLLASLSQNQDGSCTVSPLLMRNDRYVVLSATSLGVTYKIAFVPRIPLTFKSMFSLVENTGLNYYAPGGVYGAISTIYQVSNTARICTDVNVDMTDLIIEGNSQVTINMLNGFEICLAGANELTDTSAYTWAWVTSGTFTLKKYMCFHIKKTNGQAITEGTDLDTYMTNTLI